MQEIAGQRVLVLGLGGSGRSAAAFLAERGARVVAADERPVEALGELPNLPGRVELRLGRSFPDPADFDLVVPSPGVPAQRWAGRARRALGDVELAARCLSVPVVAVTGTNGKTTTTRLLECMLRAAGWRAEAAGNIGRPALELVGRPLDAAVLEVSSFQLEAVESFRPRVAIVLNVSPDHLDRHGSFESYVEAKARMVARQESGDTAIGNGDDAVAAGIVARSRGQQLLFRRTGAVARGAWWDAGAVVLREGSELVRLPVELPEAVPPESLMAALMACRALGARCEDTLTGLLGFRPLPHRRQVVARHAGITWIDDSKATNPAAAIHALDSLTNPSIWIAGGRGKGSDLGSLAEVAAKRVRAAVWIGESAHELERALAGRIETQYADSLEQAVEIAGGAARPGETVLLSPACASFDQFRSYEERGERFQEAVQAWIRRHPSELEKERD